MRGLLASVVLAMAVMMSSVSAWENWGGDAGGARFSQLSRITPENAERLIEAWTFHTGDLIVRPPAQMRRSKFEATPLLVENSLIFCTPLNEVVALDPATGRARWRYDPGIPADFRPGNRWVCRGVTHWRDERAESIALCASRIFMGTNDARVIALDAKTGQPCAGFGKAGEVKLDPGAPLDYAGEFQITSPPVVARDVVVVGSSFADNRRVASPPGIVRAFDARTGAPRWNWDPLIRDGIEAGHANVWAPMTIDAERGLVFLPTSSASPDFFGGKRPGDNKHANSVVALKIESGELAWAFQTVHHDVWDYDVPAQPTLARIDIGSGAMRDVVIQATKMGFVFVLDRDTGQPVWPVEERAVPQGGAAGESLSPTQPFPTHLPPLMPQRLDLDKPFGITFWDRKACAEQLKAGRYDGLFTPPSTEGTLLFPMTGGGVNWGGVAYDPVRQILLANTSRAVHRVTLMPRAQAQNYKPPSGTDFGPQRGAPFAMTRTVVASPLGMPCNPPPWGTMVAVDLKAGKVLWESQVGTTEDVAPLGLALKTGSPLLSGVLATAGGVVFTGAMDSYLRAFDATSGRELWQGRLPVPGVANPMTYAVNGEQYVVIGAGGHSEAGTSIGDSIVAFRLPRDGEAPSWWSLYVDRPGGRLRAGAVVGAMALVMLMLAAIHILRRRRMGRAEAR